jgi:ubiquinone/menaquinone biosynthesis C-methylase UbiE
MATVATEPETRADDFVAFVSGVLADVGRPLSLGASVLDFGCGDGSMVGSLTEAGYDAYGCDIELASETDRLRLIEQPYRLPFADETFESIVSSQVLEHVSDHDLAFREMYRVLQPGGATLHLFPPCWRPVEPHVRVPLATVIQARPWLRLWASLGVRNEFQDGLSAREVTGVNAEYLRSSTNYLTRRQLERSARKSFERVEFVERLALKHGRGRGRHVFPWVSRVSALERLYAATQTRLMVTFKS